MNLTLRKRILIFNLGTFLIALLIVGVIAFYEFKEQELFTHKLSNAEELESPAFEAFEIVLYGGIAALVIAAILSRIFLRRTLQPILLLTKQLENTDITNLSDPVPRSGNGDELDRLAVVFNRLKERLNLSFTQTREFTMNASHELKTPLSIMYATIEQMIGDEEITATHREKLDSILEEVLRLTRITSQLTFLSKFDAAQPQSEMQSIDLLALVREMSEDIDVIAADRDIQVTMQEGQAATVLGDRMMLRQLLLALADNAVKYNVDSGKIRMSLIVHQQAIFCMQNLGPTLSCELWSRIFERFFRGNALTAEGTEGCGLGLSIAKVIVEAHRGTIEFSVVDELWNTVQVRLPLA
jgi:signal transduction histidine kinase